MGKLQMEASKLYAFNTTMTFLHRSHFWVELQLVLSLNARVSNLVR